MGRNLKPKTKIARRLNIAVTDKQQRILAKRAYPPGQHGEKGHPRLSEYGKQLQEKQKAKFIYGLLQNERQFKNYFLKAHTQKGDTGENLFRLLEMRLDNVLFRAGLANTRNLTRQLVNHAHILVNGKKVDVPSYQSKIGDVIEVREKSKTMKIFADAKERFTDLQPVSWLNTDIEALSVKVIDMPKTEDVTGEFNPKLIIEFYSR